MPKETSKELTTKSASRELVVKKDEVTQKTIEEFLFSSGTKLNDQQKMMFLKMAQLNNLNPFKREIYAIPFGSNFNIVTAYQVYIARAEATGKLDGWEVVSNGDEAVITIHRKDMSKPIIWNVQRSDFDKGSGNWLKMPDFMLKKVAIGQGFRLAFPNELSAMPYTSDELDSDENQSQSTHQTQSAQQTAQTAKAAITDKDVTTNGNNLERVLKLITLPQKSIDLLVADSNKLSVKDYEHYLVGVINGFVAKAISAKKFDDQSIIDKIYSELGEIALIDMSLDNALLALDAMLNHFKKRGTK